MFLPDRAGSTMHRFTDIMFREIHKNTKNRSLLRSVQQPGEKMAVEAGALVPGPGKS
jgi:hypothetical protein